MISWLLWNLLTSLGIPVNQDGSRRFWDLVPSRGELSWTVRLLLITRHEMNHEDWFELTPHCEPRTPDEG